MGDWAADNRGGRIQKKLTEDEMLQINGCQLLLEVVVSSQTPQLHTPVYSLVGSDNTNTLTLASENFPDSCKDLVDGLLHDLAGVDS